MVSTGTLFLRVPIQLLIIILRSYRETFPVRCLHRCVCPACYLAQTQRETSGGVVGRSGMATENSCVQWSLQTFADPRASLSAPEDREGNSVQVSKILFSS